MSGGVTPEVISEVRARASILDVVAESVVLKRAGSGYKGLCPFHKEKSPSFTVNPERSIFNCFGCNSKGDVFAFVQKIRNCDFLDSVRHLAHKYGVQLVESEQDREIYSKKAHVKMIYEQACVFYQKLLADPQEGSFARQYLEARGITEETIKKFRLGFAPVGWDGLISYLTGTAQVSTALLAEAGLIREKQGGGSFYDLFRNRLMVPITNGEGQVIAFGGRALAADDQVKYINSPESPIYTKGDNLFAFNLAKDAIKENDSVIVVEGYFDAIMPHQCGFTNTVATLGTALTEAQAKLLIRYTESKRVYLSFDADQAGINAVEKGVEKLSEIAGHIGVDLRVIKIPGGKDPDECLRQSDGPDNFRKAIDTAPVLIEYQLESAIDGINLASHTGRIEAATKVVPILSRLKNAVARVEYVRQSSARLNIREEDLFHEVRTYRRDHKLDKDDQPRYPDRYSNDGGSGYANKNSGYGNNNKSSKFNSDERSSKFGNKGFQNKDGKGGQRFQPPQAHRPSAMPPREPRASKAPSGVIDAERLLLGLYLTSRDDYDRISAALADETLLTPAHQRIKEELEGIGADFNTMEDLQYKLMDRVAPDEEMAASLTEIIMRVEETKKQKAPVMVVLTECLSRILRERINELNESLRKLLASAVDDSDAITIQSKMLELKKLETNDFQSAKSMGELKSIREKVEALESAATTIVRRVLPAGNISNSIGANEPGLAPSASELNVSLLHVPTSIGIDDKELVELSVPDYEEPGYDEPDDVGPPDMDPSLN